jgi:hypothetical protein
MSIPHFIKKKSRFIAVQFAVLAFCLLFLGLESKAQSNHEGVPPWQLPPGKAAQHRPALVTPTSYGIETTGQESGDSNLMPSESEPVAMGEGYSNEGDCGVTGDCGGWDDCGDCDVTYCLNPFKNRLWVKAEALAMWSKSANLPPLVTTSSTSVTNRDQAGVLGLDTTSVLFGGENVDYGVIPGARFTFGMRCNPCEDSGLEFSYMYLADKSIDYNISSTGTPIVARPIYDELHLTEASLPIAFPGVQSGSVSVSLATEFSTLEALWRQALELPSGRQVSFLAGYRYAYFAEKLNIYSNSLYAVQVQDIAPNTRQEVTDRFDAINSFQGGEIGFATKKQYCRWSVEMLGKFALGNTRSNINISGRQVLTTTTSAVSQNGLLARWSNNGSYVENNFTVIPELGITFGYDLTERMKVTCGYSFLYWSRVARPADQIDMNVNPDSNNHNLRSPQFRYVPGDYWVQGLTLGLDYRF